MDEVNLPLSIEYARELPVADTTEIKLTLSQLVGQLENLLPSMLLQELPQWLDRFEKIQRGRMKCLIAAREQAQALLNWYKFRLDNPAAAAMPASVHALKLGLELDISQDQWPSVTLGDLRERLHAHLCDIRNDAMLAALDMLYVRTIALITVEEQDHEDSYKLEALVQRAKRSMQKD